MLLLFVIIIVKQNKFEKTTNKILNILNSNIDNINKIHRSNIISKLKNTIHIYSQFQIIQKISNADYVSLAKCNYINNKINLDFLFSIDDNTNIMKKSLLDDVSLCANCFSLDDLNPNHNIKIIDIDKIKSESEAVFHIIKYFKVKKIYRKNIYDENDILTNIIFFSYEDENYIMNDDDKNEICRIIKEEEKNILKVDSISNDDISKDHIKKISRKRKFVTKIYIALLSLLTIIALHDGFIINSNEVFDYYFKPEQISVVRGDNSHIYENEELQYIYSIYNSNEYDSIVMEFEKYFSKYSEAENEYNYYYAGVASLFAKEPGKALNFFNKIDTTSIFEESANWYKAGCYLMKNDVLSATKILKKIAEDPHNYYNKSASKILKIRIRN